MAPLNNLTAVTYPATEYVAFETRLSRTKFVVERYDKFLKGSVLDVGCYEAPLRSMLSGVVYMGIDIAGEPDQVVDLESVETLPFDEAQFQCVIYIEVLEHLDVFHRVFNELIRVSSRYVIVSLRNCWCSARRQIEKGKGSISHYGLPVERPLDRHKWFINISQAKEFFCIQSHRPTSVDGSLYRRKTQKPIFALPPKTGLQPRMLCKSVCPHVVCCV